MEGAASVEKRSFLFCKNISPLQWDSVNRSEYFSFVFPLPVQEDGKARGVEDDKCKKNDRSAFVSFPDARPLPAGDEPTKMEVLLSIR